MQTPDEAEPEVIRSAKQDAFSAQIDLEEKWASAKNSLPKGHHWIKRGPHAVCISCPMEHSHFVGMDFDTKYLKSQRVSKPVGVEPTPTSTGGDITPQASTEPVKRGRKKGAK